ncbi:MAG: hypothetical protein KY453_03440 [Gemmatimonadetes bacterium]|nr:hypothetical protein [Gemmatimonadota bacterium]
MRRPVVAGLLAVALLLAAVVGWRASGDWRERREVEALRDELRVLRSSADSCQIALAQEEMVFRDYDQRVDSLREQVADYESLHPDGVPADTYQVYLETFERYNEAVPAWRMQVDSLQAHWEACRERVDVHNVHADSLRLRLEELDLTGPNGS